MQSQPASPPEADWAIDLLRGLAALLVVATHYQYFFSNVSPIVDFARTGVDLFFAISGYLFAPYLVGRPLPVLPFLTRRFFRLYPLYLVALATYAGLHVLNGQKLEHLIVHLFFLQTLESREIAFHFNGAFWSLPPEVEFYLVLPILAKLVRGTRQVTALFAVAVTLHCLIAFQYPLEYAKTPFTTLGVHLPGLLCEFLAGSLAYCFMSQAATVRFRLLGMVIGLALLAGLCWVFVYTYANGGDVAINSNPLLRGNVGFFAACGYAIFIGGFVGCFGAPNQMIKKIALTMGNLSYGIYLFHNAAPSMLHAIKPMVSGPQFAFLCLGVTIAITAVLHVIWEAPMRSFGRTIANKLDLQKRTVANQ
jgi:exopolysaccharide production protein ExoZ